jgi:hypothetical protein
VGGLMAQQNEIYVNTGIKDNRYNIDIAGETWFFKAEENKHIPIDEYNWNADNPIIQYKSYDDTTQPDPAPDGKGPNQYTDEWDANHPNNDTRYLRPAQQTLFSISNSISNVTIDPNPPEYISDKGTEYLALYAEINGRITDDYKFSTATRSITLYFKDESGLDKTQIGFFIGDTVPSDWHDKNNENIIYYNDRKIEEEIAQPFVNKINVFGTNDGSYKVNIELYEKWSHYNSETENWEEHEITEILNTDDEENSKFNVIVWDIAGNSTIFKFTKAFKTLNVDDLNNLLPVNITFSDIEPSTFVVEDGIDVRVVTKIQNPNEILWEYENVADLMEGSVGLIDKNSYDGDDNREHNPLDGIRTFLITNVTDSGMIEVEAWVQTGYPELDDLIKERTYNTATCGPWIYCDDGRKYHITPYIPKYIQGTEFADFIEFFELYINTMYKGLENNRYISGLEKIARVANFNDISKLENSLVYLYGNEFGNEFDFNVEALKYVNPSFNDFGYNLKDTKETFEIIKYVLEQLPVYNTYKGTNTGIEMGIKMFGFSCKIINLWTKIQYEIETNPEFIEEDFLTDFSRYFLTSRFNVEVDPGNNTFETFCDNVGFFIKIIKSIKPITKILNEIKYIVTVKKDFYLAYDLDSIDSNSDEITYTFEWEFFKRDNEWYNFKKTIDIFSNLNYNINNADRIYLNNTPTSIKIGSVSVSNLLGKINVSNLLGKYFKSNKKPLILHYVSSTGDTIDVTLNDYKAYIVSGGVIIEVSGSNKNDLFNLFDNILSSMVMSFTLSLSITYLPGTNYVKSETIVSE